MPPTSGNLPLSRDDFENLRASGLTNETMRANGLYTEHDAGRIAWKLTRATFACGGLVIPYRNLDGLTDRFARVRPHEPQPDRDGKPAKYLQPNGEKNRAYFPAGSLEMLRDGASPVWVIEGEKKALASSQLGLAAVGISGFWGWIVKDTKPGDLIPDLAAISWQDRDVYIDFDYDAKPETREDSARAAQRLAGALRRAGARQVRSVELPAGADGAKQGVDDFLVAHGAAAFDQLVADAKLVPSDCDGSKGSQGSKGERAHAQILLEIALANTELWHAPNDVAFATIQQMDHSEHWRVRSATFRQWLRRTFYEREKSVIGSHAVEDVVNTLEGMARFDGPTYPVYLRCAGYDGHIYVDLGDEDWRAIEVTAAGWGIVAQPPVRFRRTKGMVPLAAPAPASASRQNPTACFHRLRQFVNVTDDGWPLVLTWLLAAFRPTGPYPILRLVGEQGSAKTTTAEVLRSIVDPNVAPLRRPPSSDRDLMIAANNGWIVAFDNLSVIRADLSDAFCSLATGSGFSTRTLYTDEEETLLVAERPILLNSIEDAGTRSDLLDRMLLINLPRIDQEKRRTEESFWQDFKEAMPGILAGLLDAVAAALQNLPAVKQSNVRYPRMADFAQWAIAGETALGLQSGQFLAAYAENQQGANQIALDSSPVARAVLDFVEAGGNFQGTATGLLNRLPWSHDRSNSDRPKTAQILSGTLNRLAPALRKAGVMIEQTLIGSGNQKRHGWRIQKARGPADVGPSTGARVPAGTTTDGARGAQGAQGPNPPHRPPAPDEKAPEGGFPPAQTGADAATRATRAPLPNTLAGRLQQLRGAWVDGVAISTNGRK